MYENTKNECRFQFPCSVSSEKEMSVLPLEKDMFILAPIRRIVWTSDQTEIVVVYFPCVVSLSTRTIHDHLHGSRFQGLRCPRKNKFITMSSMFALAHSSCLHMSVPTLSSCSSTSSTLQTTLPIKKHCVDPQKEECGPVAKTTSLLQVMSPTSTTQRLL